MLTLEVLVLLYTTYIFSIRRYKLVDKNSLMEVWLPRRCQAPMPHPAVWVNKPRRLDDFRYRQVDVVRVAYSGCDAAEPRKGTMNLQVFIRG